MVPIGNPILADGRNGKCMTTTSLLSPAEVRAQLPLSSEGKAFIAEARWQGKQILRGLNPRKALVVGPCSIHDRFSAIEYATRFKELSERVDSTCFLIMRVYTEKSRTSTGWKGFLYDPHLDSSHDIQTGILWTRELLLQLTEMQVPCAAEFVDPLAALYFEDLISWGFIGARTSASQLHRQFVSSLMEIPVGFKNSTDGNLKNAIHGVSTAQIPHTFLSTDLEGKLCTVHSEGNSLAHIVLRGSESSINYDSESVRHALSLLKKHHLPERIMVDCSHGNAQKCPARQEDVLLSVLEQCEKGNTSIFGIMLESHLESGNQMLTEDPSLLKYAVSITDPCIDWETTERLVSYVEESYSTVIRLTHS